MTCQVYTVHVNQVYMTYKCKTEIQIMAVFPKLMLLTNVPQNHTALAPGQALGAI